MTAMPMSDYDFEDIDFDALESLDEDDDNHDALDDEDDDDNKAAEK